jgi:hypothetical protein
MFVSTAAFRQIATIGSAQDVSNGIATRPSEPMKCLRHDVNSLTAANARRISH